MTKTENVITTLIDWNVVVLDEDKPIRTTWLLGYCKETRKVTLSQPLIYFERSEQLNIAQDEGGSYYIFEGGPCFLEGELKGFFDGLQRYKNNQLYLRYSVLPKSVFQDSKQRGK